VLHSWWVALLYDKYSITDYILSYFKGLPCFSYTELRLSSKNAGSSLAT
jgi:hypothetical protein